LVISGRESWRYRNRRRRRSLTIKPYIGYCRERELALQKQKATQEFIQEFKEAREQWKIIERQRMEEENKYVGLG